ncbi:hypothetical protein HMPREF3039_02965 [Akkermansia sp. KLE1798]|nr:hypothetical protein HMPREF3039_02965 [Akkermansia sp. KLE1798]
MSSLVLHRFHNFFSLHEKQAGFQIRMGEFQMRYFIWNSRNSMKKILINLLILKGRSS